MKSLSLTLVLLIINCALVMALGWPRFHQNSPPQFNSTFAAVPKPSSAIDPAKFQKKKSAPETPFAAIYSTDTKQFVENLRAIGCPEQTVKDILVAEINRRYAAQENALRPKPADHVPYGWSAKTSEGKLIARRQEAAEIAREKQAALRNALGYEVPVKIPQYAMTTSDQIFERFLDSLPGEKRPAAQAMQEQYWAEVQLLRERTRGFWQPEDVKALNELQTKRKDALANLGAAE
jgi:hypothetical protein